jgi:hypothetical protein
MRDASARDEIRESSHLELLPGERLAAGGERREVLLDFASSRGLLGGLEGLVALFGLGVLLGEDSDCERLLAVRKELHRHDLEEGKAEEEAPEDASDGRRSSDGSARGLPQGARKIGATHPKLRQISALRYS